MTATAHLEGSTHAQRIQKKNCRKNSEKTKLNKNQIRSNKISILLKRNSSNKSNTNPSYFRSPFVLRFFSFPHIKNKNLLPFGFFYSKNIVVLPLLPESRKDLVWRHCNSECATYHYNRPLWHRFCFCHNQ